jgi:hypothetical protein
VALAEPDDDVGELGLGRVVAAQQFRGRLAPRAPGRRLQQGGRQRPGENQGVLGRADGRRGGLDQGAGLPLELEQLAGMGLVPAAGLAQVLVILAVRRAEQAGGLGAGELAADAAAGDVLGLAGESPGGGGPAGLRGVGSGRLRDDAGHSLLLVLSGSGIQARPGGGTPGRAAVRQGVVAAARSGSANGQQTAPGR